jgi:hypothetical protein
VPPQGSSSARMPPAHIELQQAVTALRTDVKPRVEVSLAKSRSLRKQRLGASITVTGTVGIMAFRGMSSPVRGSPLLFVSTACAPALTFQSLTREIMRKISQTKRFQANKIQRIRSKYLVYHPVGF